jgi:hypothetical protein
MVKDERPVLVVEVLVKPYAWHRLRDHPFQGGLAHGKRIAPEIVAVELDQVERPHENVCVMPPVSDTVE